MWRKLPFVLFILISPVIIGLVVKLFWPCRSASSQEPRIPPVGTVVDRLHGVAVHSNGKDCYTSHGKHFSSRDGYYYGKRWQCVEFVKRYYHDRFGHHMPDVWGHAKSYFDPSVPHGALNTSRGLIQFHNGGNEKPRPDDLLVYTHGQYGHVAIISSVQHNQVEIVQQNIAGHPRTTLPMKKTSTGWTLGEDNKPTGWLRLPSTATTIHQP